MLSLLIELRLLNDLLEQTINIDQACLTLIEANIEFNKLAFHNLSYVHQILVTPEVLAYFSVPGAQIWTLETKHLFKLILHTHNSCQKCDIKLGLVFKEDRPVLYQHEVL